MVRCNGNGMFHDHAAGKGMPKRRQCRRRRKKPHGDDGELDSGLAGWMRRPPPCNPLQHQGGYKPLMPSAIAVHNSCKRGLNSIIAKIAITTSTPTRMAYSVVP